MKQKSKLKDLIEDIVDSDLLALDESDYQSQEESRDEDEDDDLEEAEDEESEDEDKKKMSEGEDEESEDEDEEESEDEDEEDEDEEDEDEEDEDEEKLEEGSMDSLSLSDLWNKHRSYTYTADQGYGGGYGSAKGGDAAAEAIYKFVSTKYGKKTADDMKAASDYYVAYNEYAGPGDAEEAESAEENLRKKYKIEESEDEEDKKEVEEKYENFKIDLSNVTSLIESETGLTEEFKSKAALIFEAEVKSQLRTIKEGLENKYSRRLEEAVSFVEDKLTEQIDGYLTYAVQQWMKENQVAIESSLRTEIAENFMGSLKTLFTESYVEVPASKVDLYAKLEEEKQEVEAKLGRSLELLGGLVEKVEDLSREKAIEEACEGLTQTQAVRLKKLAESVEFSDESSFKDKVQTLKEFYFADKGLKNKTQKTLTEEFSNYEDSEIETIVEGQILSTTKIDPEMSQYLKALNAMNKSVTY